MSSRSSSASNLDATPLGPLESIPYLTCAFVAWQSLLLTSYISFGFLSPMIVLIDVRLSHLFVFSSTFLLFRCLGVNFLAHAHQLHECSIYRKGVDQFDLYLASGLGTSPDKNPKEPKCETLVDSCSQQPFFSLSSQSLACTQTPFGDIRVTDSKSSCTFCSFVPCVNANIYSCLIRLELNCML